VSGLAFAVLAVVVIGATFSLGMVAGAALMNYVDHKEGRR